MDLHEILLASKIVRKNGSNSADLSDYYTKSQTNGLISEKVAEIVANAPNDFDTLKELSDWIAGHEDSVAAMNSAIAADTTAITTKVDKVSSKGLSTNDFTNTDKSKLDSLENYDDTNVKADVAEVTSRASINGSTLGYQRKNMINLSAKTQTKAGVTYSCTDGLVNGSGTTTGNSTYIVFEPEVPLVFDRDVIVSRIGEITNTACRARLGEAGSYEYPSITKSGYRIPAGTKISQVYIQQTQSGIAVSVTNLGVMLRYADITDDTYEPYKPSVEERLTALENAISGGN